MANNFLGGAGFIVLGGEAIGFAQDKELFEVGVGGGEKGFDLAVGEGAGIKLQAVAKIGAEDVIELGIDFTFHGLFAANVCGVFAENTQGAGGFGGAVNVVAFLIDERNKDEDAGK